MKGSIFLVLSSLLIPFLSHAQSTTLTPSNLRQEAPTKIGWERHSIELGYLQQDEARREVLRYRNTGQTPLFITGVKHKCQHFSVQWSTKAIPPGGEGQLILTIQHHEKGPLNCYLTVMSTSQSYVDVITINGIVY